MPAVSRQPSTCAAAPASFLALRRRLWLTLAALTAVGHITMVSLTQESPTRALMALLIWGGALICLEDQLPELAPAPSAFSLGLGSLLLAVGLQRTAAVLHLDSAVVLLPIWLGTGLGLLYLPLRRLLRWGPSLLVLALLPLSEQLARVLPEQPLSHLTARLCQALLLLGGVDAAAAGRQVTLTGGSVLIADTCAGIDVIAQLLVIAVVFVLAFPLPLRRSRWLLLAIAPLVALLGNAFRIALLALISASQWPNKDWWFGFFHEESGSLMFSGLSVAVFGWIYLAVLERQLQARERRI